MIFGNIVRKNYFDIRIPSLIIASYYKNGQYFLLMDILYMEKYHLKMVSELCMRFFLAF